MKTYLSLGSVLILIAIAAGCDKVQSQTTPGAAPGAKTAGPPGPQMPPQEVYVAKPEVMKVTDHEDFTGHLEAVQSVTYYAEVMGRLEKINFKDGAHVKAGDLLFEIEPDQYQADYNARKAMVDQAETTLAQTKSDFERAQITFANKAISQEQYDQYKFAFLGATAAVNTARSNLKVSDVALGHTKVLSTITGKVGKHMADVGALVGANGVQTPLVTVVTEDPIHAVFDVDERTLLRFRRLIQDRKMPKHGAVTVQISLADETNFNSGRTGTINFEDNTLDPQSATIRWRAEVPNGDRFLTPGLFIRVRVPIGEPHDAIVIPESALGSDQGRKFVYVVNAEKKVEYRPVTVGTAVGHGKRAIDDGLKSNETIIVTGLQRAAMTPPGSVVVPKPYAEAKSGEGAPGGK